MRTNKIPVSKPAPGMHIRKMWPRTSVCETNVMLEARFAPHCTSEAALSPASTASQLDEVSLPYCPSYSSRTSADSGGPAPKGGLDPNNVERPRQVVDPRKGGLVRSDINLS